MNIYEEIIDWLKITCPFSDWVYFNAIRMEVGTNSTYSISGTTVLEKYIDGSTNNELVFGISLIRLYSSEMSDDNLTAMNEINLIVEAINEATTLPILDSNYIVDRVEIVQDIPSVNIDQDANICEYQIQAKINYLKKAG
jgi:hypothetical protein